MKRISILLIIAFISSNIFGQAELPVCFKTVNGKGICGTAAEIRVYFDELPAYLPSIAQVRAEQRDIPGIVIANVDDSEFEKKGYVSYCILSATLLPAGKLSIRFHYEDSGFDYWITETKGKHINMGH